MDMQAKETVARWLNIGTTVGVFQNKDLGHPDIGRKVAMPFDYDEFQTAEIGTTRCPDNPTVGLGWRYILVAKCDTLQEVVDAMVEETVQSQEQS
jgi:hypothetical protein